MLGGCLPCSYHGLSETSESPTRTFLFSLPPRRQRRSLGGQSDRYHRRSNGSSARTSIIQHLTFADPYQNEEEDEEEEFNAGLQLEEALGRENNAAESKNDEENDDEVAAARTPPPQGQIAS